MDDKKPEENNLDTLENPGTATSSSEEENSLESSGDTSADKSGLADAPAVKPKKSRLQAQNLITHVNIYLLLFILIVVLTLGIAFVGYQRNKKIDTPTPVATQPLDPEALQKLKGSEVKVGDPKQVLTIESHAMFSGKVLIRDSLDVAGSIKVGGPLSLPGITVSGTSSFDQIQANNLSITGNVNVAGQLTIQKTLTVTGGASFGGPISAPQLSIQSLQLNSDLQLNRHLDAGGGTPSRTDGGALGSGGTSSVSGSDTAGTVTINTGSNTAAGCFLTVIFAQKFNATPHVVITPVGEGGAALDYYVTRTTTSFNICTTNAAPAGRSFSFDYIAID